ncbi:MAG: hypothetical protein ABSF64_05955 [Bryobacteraceae bacterium]
MLRDVHDPNARVFVVWEPVLFTDWHAPGAGAVGRIPDARVTQFWDPRRALSQAIRRGRVVWDYVAIFPAGLRWGDVFPPPQFSGAPVVRVVDDFRRQLAANGRSAGGSSR